MSGFANSAQNPEQTVPATELVLLTDTKVAAEPRIPATSNNLAEIKPTGTNFIRGKVVNVGRGDTV